MEIPLPCINNGNQIAWKHIWLKIGRHISGCKKLLASMEGDKMKQKTLLLSANDLSCPELSGSSKNCARSLSDGCAQFDDQSSVNAAGMHLILSLAM